MRTAVHSSPVARFRTRPADVSETRGPSSTASMSPKRGTPCLAFRLPSTGSTRTSGKSAPKFLRPASSDSTENFSPRFASTASSPRTIASAARSSSIVVSPPAPTVSGARPASVPLSGSTTRRTPSPIREKTSSHSALVRGRELMATPLSSWGVASVLGFGRAGFGRDLAAAAAPSFDHDRDEVRLLHRPHALDELRDRDGVRLLDAKHHERLRDVIGQLSLVV